MKNYLGFKLILLFSLVSLLLFGCTMPSLNGNSNGTLDNTTDITSVGDTDTNISNTLTNESITPVDPDKEDLSYILSLKDNLEYSAVYTTVLLNVENVSTGKSIIYSKLDKYRHDSIVGTEETIISLYLIPEGNYSCVDAIGKIICNEIQSSSNPDVSFDELENYQIIKLPTRTVMNKTGNCFMFSNQNGSIEQCFLDTGVPLYLHITNPNGIEFTQSLKSIDYTVEDSIFELP